LCRETHDVCEQAKISCAKAEGKPRSAASCFYIFKQEERLKKKKEKEKKTTARKKITG